MPCGTSPLDEARLQGRLWSPALLRPAIWLDASDISTISIVGTGVSEWRDKSGNNKNYAQSNSSLRPTYEYTVPDANARFPGVPQLGVRFKNNISTQWMDNTSFAYTGNQMQMFSVHRNSSTEGAARYSRVFSFSLNSSASDNANTDGLIVSYGITTNSVSVFRAGASIANSSANVNNLWIIANGRRSAGTGRIATNGGAYVTGTTSTANQNIGYSRIGNDNAAGDSGMNGWICENLLYTTELSDAQCQIVEGYLAWKWGIVALLPATHPYRNRPPLIGA